MQFVLNIKHLRQTAILKWKGKGEKVQEQPVTSIQWHELKRTVDVEFSWT